MAGFIDSITNAIGKPGRKLYENSKRESSFHGMGLKEKLQSLVLEKRLMERDRRQRQNMTWYLMALYYRGYQQVGVSDSATIDVYEDQDFYIENQFRRHVDTVRQILNRMEGDLIIRPASSAPSDIATARVADPILDMQRREIGYDKIKDEKSFFKCLFGNAFIFTDYITDAKFGSIVTPKFSYEPQPDPENPDEPFLSKVVTGYETRPRGRQISTVCSPLEINILPEIRPFTEAPFIQWVSQQDQEVVEYMYPGLNTGDGSMTANSDLAQQYIDILSMLPGNVLGSTLAYNRGSSVRNKCEVIRSWLQPCTFRGDKELLRQFPSGVHVATVNGAVVDYYDEDFRDRWTHEVLIPSPHSLLGDGLYDAILQQDMLNEVNSLLVQHLRYSTTGKFIYDTNCFDAKNIVNDPKYNWIPANPSLDKNITNVIQQLNPGQLSSDTWTFRAAVSQSMQDMTGAYDPEAGKSLGANTPYSQSVFLAEKAQGRWKSSYNYNEPERTRFHRQLLEDARKNWLDLRERAVVNNTGQWSFEQFSQADLQGDVDITMADSDFKPKTRAEQVQAMTMLMQMMPLIPTLPPKQKLRLEEMMGLPPDANPMSTQVSRAYRNIDRIKKGEIVTPLPMVDDASVQAPVYFDYLASEDGESLADSEPETYSNIYTYAMNMVMMASAQMASPGGQMASQIVSRQQATGAPGKGGIAEPPKPAGGQVGQEGGGPQGGPGSAQQPSAQSPVQPAPPVAPPSPGA